MPFASEKEEQIADGEKEIAEGSINNDVDVPIDARDLHQSIIQSMNEVPKFSDEWFRLKEMEISLRGGLGVDRVGDQDEKSSQTLTNCDKKPVEDKVAPASAVQVGAMMDSSTNCLARPEQMPSMSDALVPAGMAVRGSASDNHLQKENKFEMISDEAIPDANIGLLSEDTCGDKTSGRSHSPETIDGDCSCPMPYELNNIDRAAKSNEVGQFNTSNYYDTSAIVSYPSLEDADFEHELVGSNNNVARCSSAGEIEQANSSFCALNPLNCEDESIFHPPLEEADSEHELVRPNNVGMSGSGRDIEQAVEEAHLTTRESTDTPLIEAWAVDESSASETDDQSVYVAEQVTGCYKFNAKAITGVCILVLVALGISLYALIKPASLNPENNATASVETTPEILVNEPSPTPTPTTKNHSIKTEVPSSTMLLREAAIKEELEARILRRGIKFDELGLGNSRSLALEWLLHQDEMELHATSSHLGQRYILALLAFQFGDLFRSKLNWLSNKSECDWYWVTCNGELEVTNLDLG
jgi:hypothetical protein